MKISIIGTGVFSTSIAIALAKKQENQIIMWSENADLVANFKKTKKLNTIFKDKVIPKNITLTDSYDAALENADIVFLITSVVYFDGVCQDIKDKVNKKVPICIATKGIAMDSCKFVHEIANKILKNPISIISGPTFGEDVANLDPVGFTVASKNKRSLRVIRKVFPKDMISLINTDDLTGIAVCGCVKNIYAIGAGIIDGLGFHESTLSFYLTSVYEELENILYKYNSTLSTLHSLAGFGDLILTCFSNKSRNYTYGKMLGKKTSKKELKEYSTNHTIEGINTLNAILNLFKKRHVKAPIISKIYDIVIKEEKPDEIIHVIMKKGN